MAMNAREQNRTKQLKFQQLENLNFRRLKIE
jgi:hypothetical protein